MVKRLALALGRGFREDQRRTPLLVAGCRPRGKVLERFVTKTRDKMAALKFRKKTLKRYGRTAELVTDRLCSCRAALKGLGALDLKESGHWANSRAGISHPLFRRRERAMLRFRRMWTLQKFASVHASAFNHFNLQRSLSTRAVFKQIRNAVLAEWRGILAA